MKKKKCSNHNFIAAIFSFALAIIIKIWELGDVWPLYGLAALFWISWQFDKTNWLMLDIARTFVDGLSRKGKEENNDQKP